MYTIGFGSKHTDLHAGESFAQYLILPSEPGDKASEAAGYGSFGFRNRYLAKRRVMRTIRRLRRERTSGL